MSSPINSNSQISSLFLSNEEKITFQRYIQVLEHTMLAEADIDVSCVKTFPNEYQDAYSYVSSYLSSTVGERLSFDNPEHQELLAIGLNFSRKDSSITKWNPEFKETALKMRSAWAIVKKEINEQSNLLGKVSLTALDIVKNPVENVIKCGFSENEFVTSSDIYSLYPEGITKDNINTILKLNLDKEIEAEVLKKAVELNSKEIELCNQKTNKVLEAKLETNTSEEKLETNHSSENDEEKSFISKSGAFLFSKMLTSYFAQDNQANQSEAQAKENKKIILKGIEQLEKFHKIKLDKIESYRTCTPDAIEINIHELLNKSHRTHITQKEKEQNSNSYLSVINEMNNRRRRCENREKACRENLKDLNQINKISNEKYRRDSKKADRACRKAHRAGHLSQLVNLLDFSKSEIPMVQSALAMMDPSGMALAAIGPIVSSITQKNIQRTEKKRNKVNNKFIERSKKIEAATEKSLNKLDDCLREENILDKEAYSLLCHLLDNPQAYHHTSYRKNLENSLTNCNDDKQKLSQRQNVAQEKLQNIQKEQEKITTTINTILEKDYKNEIKKERNKIQEYDEKILSSTDRREIKKLEKKKKESEQNIENYRNKSAKKNAAQLIDLQTQYNNLEPMKMEYEDELYYIAKDQGVIDGKITEITKAITTDDKYKVINAYVSDVAGEMESSSSKPSEDEIKARKDLEYLHLVYGEYSALKRQCFDVLDKCCKLIDPTGLGFEIPIIKKRLRVNALGTLLKAVNTFEDMLNTLSITSGYLKTSADNLSQGGLLKYLRGLTSEANIKNILLPSALTLAQGINLFHLANIFINGTTNPMLDFLYGLKKDINKKLNSLDEKAEHNITLTNEVKNILHIHDKKLNDLSMQISEGNNEVILSVLRTNHQNQENSELHADAYQISRMSDLISQFIQKTMICQSKAKSNNINKIMMLISHHIKLSYVQENNGHSKNTPLVSLKTISQQPELFTSLISSSTGIKNFNVPNFYLLSAISDKYIEFVQEFLSNKQKIVVNKSIYQAFEDILKAHYNFSEFLSPITFDGLYKKALSSKDRLKSKLNQKIKKHVLNSKYRMDLELKNAWLTLNSPNNLNKDLKVSTLSFSHSLLKSKLPIFLNKDAYLDSLEMSGWQAWIAFASLSILPFVSVASVGVFLDTCFTIWTAGCLMHITSPVEKIKQRIDKLMSSQPLDNKIEEINKVFNSSIQNLFNEQGNIKNKKVFANNNIASTNSVDGIAFVKYSFSPLKGKWESINQFTPFQGQILDSIPFLGQSLDSIQWEGETPPDSLLSFDIKTQFRKGSIVDFKILENEKNIIKMNEISQVPELKDLDLNFEAKANILREHYTAFINHLIEKKDLDDSNVFKKIKEDFIPIPGEKENAIPLIFPKKRIEAWIAKKTQDHFLLRDWVFSFKYELIKSAKKENFYDININFYYIDKDEKKHKFEPFCLGRIDSVSLNAFRSFRMDQITKTLKIDTFNPNEVLPLFCYRSLIEGLGLPGKDSKVTASGFVIPYMTEVKDDFFTLWCKPDTLVEYNSQKGAFTAYENKIVDIISTKDERVVRSALEVKMNDFLQSPSVKQYQKDMTYLQAYCELITSYYKDNCIWDILGWINPHSPLLRNSIKNVDLEAFKYDLFNNLVPSHIFTRANEQKQKIESLGLAFQKKQEKSLSSQYNFIKLE